ncbi:sensor histidine kinase [Streptomyces noursei]|uniref:sensor histidine kinase n=1 Tax=Streptomyces noursei TaxID=1971 RepID=UPI0030F1BFA2
MTRPVQGLVAAALGRRARLRWVHLLLGGALLMPYYLVTNVLVAVVWPESGGFLSTSLGWQFTIFALALIPGAATALHPLVRPLVSGPARALCGVPGAGLETGPSRSWAARGRTALWYTLHLLTGGLVSGVSLAVPPLALMLIAVPVTGMLGGGRMPWGLGRSGASWWLLAPLAGIGLLAGVLALSWAAGALLARCAPVLLGPTAADRLAAAEQHAMQLALRNRLARELHDSVGHALSAVTLQAVAARRVLDVDLEFVRQALAAIETTTREAVGELDTVLGLLREEGPTDTAPAPTLTGLDALLERTRAAGAALTLDAPTALDRIPPVVSREAYRIVQEGLGNALRHADQAPIRLRIAVHDDALEIDVENPIEPTTGPAPRRRGGGRGLPGIAERARLLRGEALFGEHGGVWRLAVRLPLSGSAQ